MEHVYLKWGPQIAEASPKNVYFQQVRAARPRYLLVPARRTPRPWESLPFRFFLCRTGRGWGFPPPVNSSTRNSIAISRSPNGLSPFLCTCSSFAKLPVFHVLESAVCWARKWLISSLILICELSRLIHFYIRLWITVAFAVFVEIAKNKTVPLAVPWWHRQKRHYRFWISKIDGYLIDFWTWCENDDFVKISVSPRQEHDF